MLTFKNFNIADWFSFYRIIAAPVLLLLIYLDLRIIFASFLLISYSTDAIDGFLARRLKIVSPRGSQLDSIGDQITFIIGLIGMFYFENEFIKTNLVLILIASAPYFIQMILAYIKYGKATSFHTYLAKFSALVQGVFILWSLFFNPIDLLFYSMLIIGVLETTEEITLIFIFEKWVSDVKGLVWVVREKKNNKR